MKTLNVESRLEYARAAVSVLRALRTANATMRYGDFAKAIDLMSDNDEWQPWHRQQVRNTLNLVAATEQYGGVYADSEPLEYERIVNAEGQPGEGFHKTSRIVTT